MREKRMKEILKRLAQIKTECAAPEANLTALEEESRSLTAEYEQLRAEQESAEERERILNDAMNRGSETRRFAGESVPEERTFAVDSVEYRNAYLRNLMGQELDAEERAAVTASGTIPTITFNRIIDAMQSNPLINAVDVMHIPGNISLPVAGTVSPASWVAMGTAATDSADAVTTINLAAYKLIKTVEITADLAAMSIDAFETWLVTSLANQIENAVAASIITGTGIGQATGLEVTKATVDGNFAKTAMTYKNLMTIIGSLPSQFLKNASFALNRTLFFGEVLGMQTTGGDKVVVADAQAPCKFNIMGFPVILTDDADEDDIYFGDLKYYKFNFAQDPEVKRDESVGFRSGSTVFRAMALADGKLSLASAIVRYTRSAT